MVRFFIDRPIFATVLSVLVTLAGALSVGTLPLSQYPPVTPPTIQIDCNFPGASAQTVAETIAAPIEQQVNGVERMLYMSSQSTSDGTYTLTVTFQIGTDLNLAQVLVQNRVNLAMPNLPDVVRATGVTTRKRSPEILLTVALNSPDNTYDQLYLSNYAVLRLKDELQRLPGISDVTIFGQRDYAMRVWLDPPRLAARGLGPTDVVAALREQNLQVAAGQLGGPPTPTAGPVQLTITTLGRLETPEQFGEVVLKAVRGGAVVKLKDVARIELGAKNQDVANRFDNKPTVGLAIFLLTGANALETGDAVKAKMEELSQDFPPGMIQEVGYDTTPFIRDSLKEVFNALRDAVILVGVVVLLFLQSWRAAIIPLAAVPVAIVGTFAAMAAVGFTLNNLTLFGLVLAVGIVVDDAIVVVEAVQHHIDEGNDPRTATIKAMEQVTGPVIAVGVVLVMVFIPGAFLEGIVGQFFRQFALTIAISTMISTFNSLTLSPALAAVLLRPKGAKPDILTRLINLLFGWLFWLFNRGFRLAGRGYVWGIGKAIRPLGIALAVAAYVGLLAGGGRLLQTLPTGFIPSQDKGYLIASVQLPDAASAERTREAMQRIAKVFLETPGVRHVNAVAGNSFVLSAYGSNFGSMFVILDGFDERRTPDLYADALVAKLSARVAAAVPEAQVNIFGAPAVSGLGRAGGVRLMVQDRNDLGPKRLEGQSNALIDRVNQQPQLKGVFTVYKASAPQVFLDVDRTACQTHGLALRDVYGALQASMGSRYVNDFNRFGRTWQVNVQADMAFRNGVEDIKAVRVRNRTGQMVPLGTVLTAKEVGGPQVITRYNTFPAAALTGNVAPGVSSGDAIAVFETLADDTLAPGMTYAWTELTFIEKMSGGITVPVAGWKLQIPTAAALFGLSVAFVFLALAFLYESYSLPLAVVLVVPVCVVACLAGLWLAGQNPGELRQAIELLWQGKPWAEATAGLRPGREVNIFTQVGFVVLIGLACKNAILIVEFAKLRRDEGASRREAVLAACKLRFRPIVMTSVAFLLGVVPLLTATGAGAEMRRALGLAVFSGMIGVTVFGILLTPVFYVLIDWLAGTKVFDNRLGRWLGRTAGAVAGLRFVRPAVAMAVRAARHDSDSSRFPCSPASSSTARSPRRCCPSCSPWPGRWRSSPCPSPSTRTSPRPRSKSPPSTPGRTPAPSPTPSPPPSSSR